MLTKLIATAMLVFLFFGVAVPVFNELQTQATQATDRMTSNFENALNGH
jgi:hypothetical protein